MSCVVGAGGASGMSSASPLTYVTSYGVPSMYGSGPQVQPNVMYAQPNGQIVGQEGVPVMTMAHPGGGRAWETNTMSVPTMYGQPMPCGQQIQYGDHGAIYYTAGAQPSMYHPQGMGAAVQRLHSPLHSMPAVNIQSYVGPPTAVNSAVPVPTNASFIQAPPSQAAVRSISHTWAAAPSPPAGGVAVPTVTTSGGVFKQQPVLNSAVFPAHLATPRVVAPSAQCQGGQFIVSGCGQYAPVVPTSMSMVVGGPTPTADCGLEGGSSAVYTAAQYYNILPSSAQPLQQHMVVSTPREMMASPAAEEQQQAVQEQQLQSSTTFRVATAMPVAASSPATFHSALLTPRESVAPDEASTLPEVMCVPAGQPIAFAPAGGVSAAMQLPRMTSAASTARAPSVEAEEPNSTVEEPNFDANVEESQPVPAAAGTSILVQAVEVEASIVEPAADVSEEAPREEVDVAVEENHILQQQEQQEHDDVVPRADAASAIAAGAGSVVLLPKVSSSPTPSSETAAQPIVSEAGVVGEMTMPEALAPTPVLSNTDAAAPAVTPRTPQAASVAIGQTQQQQIVTPMPIYAASSAPALEVVTTATPIVAQQAAVQTVQAVAAPMNMPIYTNPSVEATDVGGAVLMRPAQVISPRVAVEAPGSVQRAYSGGPRAMTHSSASELIQHFHSAAASTRPVVISAASCWSSSDVLQQAPQVLATTPRATLPIRCSSGPADYVGQICSSSGLAAPVVPGLLSAEAIRKRSPLFTKCSVIQEPGQEVPSIEEEEEVLTIVPPVSAEAIVEEPMEEEQQPSAAAAPAVVEEQPVPTIEKQPSAVPTIEKQPVPTIEKPGPQATASSAGQTTNAVFNISAEQFALISRGKNLSDREIIELTGIEAFANDGETRTEYRSLNVVASDTDEAPSALDPVSGQPVSSAEGVAESDAVASAEAEQPAAESAEEEEEEPAQTEGDDAVVDQMKTISKTELSNASATSSQCAGDAAPVESTERQQQQDEAAEGAAENDEAPEVTAASGDEEPTLPDMSLNLGASSLNLNSTPDADAAGGAPPSARGSADADAVNSTVKHASRSTSRNHKSSKSARSCSPAAHINKVRRKPFKASTTSASRRMCC